MIFTATIELKDAEFAPILDEDDSDLSQELSDMLRFDVARVLRIEWQRDAPAVVIGSAPGERVEERAVGAI